MNALAEIPDHLRPLSGIGHKFGTLDFNPEKKEWTIQGEPVVAEMAKRLFPRCEGRGRGNARFADNRRTNEDLHWLMIRYPLDLTDSAKAKYEKTYEEVLTHWNKRQAIYQAPKRATMEAGEFEGTLMPFQEEGLAWLLNQRRTLLADEMGLGKTIQALAFLAKTNAYPALIVVPPHLVTNWLRAIGQFMPKQPRVQQNLFDNEEEPLKDQFGRLAQPVHVIKGLKPYDLPEASIYIIHYLLLRGWKKELPDFGFQTVIFDEIQELRHAGSLKYSAASLIAEQAPNAIGLSGTPIYGRGAEIWNVMNIIEYHCLSDYESFTREWCEGYGLETVADPDTLGDYLKREGLLLRRTKQQVLTDLPPKRRVVETIDFDKDKFGELIQGAADKAMLMDKITDWKERGRMAQEIINTARQATGVSKAPFAAAFVKWLLDAGEKVLLFAFHHAVHEILMDELKDYNPVKISGAETQAQKDKAVDDFMNDRSNVCLVSLRAAAGLNLQKAKVVVFAELDWSPAVHSQAEDRAHRIGQEDSVLAYYLVCEEGTDPEMQDALGLKASQFIGLMGDQEETEEDRMLAQKAAESHLNKVIARLKNRKSA